MIEKPINLGVTIAIAVGVFIATAIVDSLINVWIFKKTGGCPLHSKMNKINAVIPVKKVTGRAKKVVEPVLAP